MGKICRHQFRWLTAGIILLAAYTPSATAESNAAFAGSFLRMGLGAKSLAMGNTGVAGPVNAYSTFYNPAALGTVQKQLFGVSYSFLSLDRQFSFIGATIKIPPEAGASISWIRTSVGDLKSYSTSGEPLRDIDHSANAIYFSFGRPIFDKLYLGISIKILFENIGDGTAEFDYNSEGVGFDFGLLYKYSDHLRFGYQVRDINSKLKASTDKLFEFGGTTIDEFPQIHKFGIYYIPEFYGIRAIYEFERSNKGDAKQHFGVETVYGENLALRLGLNDGDFAFGAGIDFEFMQFVSYLDYAFIPSVIDEGSSHVFSWQFGF